MFINVQRNEVERTENTEIDRAFVDPKWSPQDNKMKYIQDKYKVPYLGSQNTSTAAQMKRQEYWLTIFLVFHK